MEAILKQSTSANDNQTSVELPSRMQFDHGNYYSFET